MVALPARGCSGRELVVALVAEVIGEVEGGSSGLGKCPPEGAGNWRRATRGGLVAGEPWIPAECPGADGLPAVTSPDRPLPVTSSLVESLVGKFNARLKSR